MISICIPVFNTNILLLIQELSAQAEKLSVPVEIVIVDDGSSALTQHQNKEIQQFPLVNYKIQPVNSGRIKARMALAGFAKYPWLLFIDDDSKIIKENFLLLYSQHINDINYIIAGGRKYQENKPGDCAFHLHWKYGSTREHNWQQERNNWQGFQSNNFQIHKTVFDALAFPQELTGYGHEDTWMGMQLEQQGKKIIHIDNPVLHDRLETADSFIKKAESALDNLSMLKKISNERALSQHIKIYRTYKKIYSLKMTGLFSMLYSLRKKTIEKNIRSCDPSLVSFDLYRLNYLINKLR